MKTIRIVIIMVLEENEQSPLVVMRGGWEKTYAVCSNKDNAIKIKKEIERIGTQGLRNLKILKKNESMTECYVGYPLCVDNHKAIFKKLSSV